MIRNRIRQRMEDQGITSQADLARRMGLKESQVSRLLSGEPRNKNAHPSMNLGTLSRLCRALQCQPGDLLEYVDDQPEGGTL